jgi:hypothetical protein
MACRANPVNAGPICRGINSAIATSSGRATENEVVYNQAHGLWLQQQHIICYDSSSPQQQH